MKDFDPNQLDEQSLNTLDSITNTQGTLIALGQNVRNDSSHDVTVITENGSIEVFEPGDSGQVDFIINDSNVEDVILPSGESLPECTGVKVPTSPFRDTVITDHPQGVEVSNVNTGEIRPRIEGNVEYRLPNQDQICR